jgi:lipopolysaccharide/colanic/teichoic acid biosynthesis glycosyltransferase
MQQYQVAQSLERQADITAKATFRFYDVVRRAVDIAAASMGLLLCAPLIAAIALLIKLDTPGPVFYRQVRVGRDRRRQRRSMALHDNVVRLDMRRDNLCGRPFRMAKFRTMYIDAEALTGPIWASENDPRITRVGRLLRHTRLDEIPQLWNVLVGEMTIIGPRPERPEFVRLFCQQIDHYADRQLVTPGITGLAQVRQGYDRSLDDVRSKVSHDLEYIRDRSLFLDLSICFRTIAVMLHGTGAH